MYNITDRIITIHEETKTYYKRFLNRLLSHPKPLISNLAIRTNPRNSPRCPKRNWCRDLLTFFIINGNNSNSQQ